MSGDDKTIQEPIIDLENSSTASNEIFKSEEASVNYLTEKDAKDLSRKEYEQLGRSYGKIVEELKKYVDKEKEKIDSKANDTKKELEDKIENYKLTIIETLGIFVALFTFISVDFQVFKSYRNPWAIGGLSLILLGSISFLLFGFDFYILQARAIKNKSKSSYESKGHLSGIWERSKNHPTRSLLFAMSFIFIFSGMMIFANSPVEELNDHKEEIKKEVLGSLQKDLNNQKKDLEAINNKNGIIIKKYDDNLKKFKECIKNFGFTYKCF